MENTATAKTLLIIVVVIAFAGFAYWGFSRDGDGGLDVVSFEDSPESIGVDIQSLLQQLESLSIDNTLFESNLYRSLVDYTVDIPEQRVGRQNPFAPVPGFPLVSLRAN